MILRGLDGQPLSDGERAALTVRLRDVLRERSESLARAVGFVEAGDRGSARRAGLRALGLAEEAGRLVRAIEGGGANDPGSVRRLDLGGAALDLDTLVREVEVVRGERPTPDLRPRQSAVDFPGLSTRESEVLALICEGLSNQEVADRLFVSVNSVKTYIRQVYGKTGVTRRTQAVAWAHRHGWLG